MHAKSEDTNYMTRILENNLLIDTTKDKGGTGNFNRPHDLLEAALASCLNIVLVKEAERNNLKHIKFETTVILNRNNPEESLFEYSYKILSENIEITKYKEVFDKSLASSSVMKTLSKKINFKHFDKIIE